MLNIAQEVSNSMDDYILSPEEKKSVDEAIEYAKQKLYEKSDKIFIPLAEKGSGVAQYNLALSLYNRGDFVNAAKWFQILAERGNYISYAYMGILYKLGYGVPLNPAKTKFILEGLEDLSNTGSEELCATEASEAAKFLRDAIEAIDKQLEEQNIQIRSFF